MTFTVGSYVLYLGKVWIVDAVYDDMMFLRDVDSDAIELVCAWEYDRVRPY